MQSLNDLKQPYTPDKLAISLIISNQEPKVIGWRPGKESAITLKHKKGHQPKF